MLDSITELQNVSEPQIGLYMHFPFCRRKCGYCSFVSYENREADISEYVGILKKEIALQSTGQKIKSIYLGGGTPTLLSVEQIEGVLSFIGSHFTLDEAVEVTIEANPGIINTEYLAFIRKLGINRLSLGVQSFSDDELKILGRIHTSIEAREAVSFAREAGFENVSLDLIYGIPRGTIPSWQDTLNKAIALEPEHLSLYPLSLEPDTPLDLSVMSGEIPAIDPDQTADQYELAEDLLAQHGYNHYEISNWAREGRECQHNMIYWNCMPYLGIGVAAHSFIDGCRFANTTNIDTYLNSFSNNQSHRQEMSEEIGAELQFSEAVILGLRLVQGINLDDMLNRFNLELLKKYGKQVDELISLGLLEYADRCIRLTRRGRLLGNEVFWRFLPAYD